VNVGSISVLASGANNTDSVQAFGIDTGMVSGSVTNAGTLTAQAVAGGSYSANAYGIQAWGVTADGAISNSGSLSVMATNSGSSRAFAAGIHTEDGDMAGLVENTGTLYVSAAASSATASAIGIFGENAVSGTISNEGMIWAAASGPEAYAVGIGAMDVTGTGEIVNSGTVLASATGSSGQAWGIAALNLDGAIVNSGYVAASGVDESWALYVGTGSGTISNATAGTIAGDFEIQASGVTFMNSGLLDLGYADAYHAGDFVEYGSGVLSIIVDSDDASDYGSLTIGGASNMMNADGAAAVLQVDISGFTTGLTGATVIEDVITFADATYDMSDDEYELDINETSYILDFAVVKDDDNTVDIMAYIDYDGGHSVWQQVQPTYWQTAKGVSQQFDYLIENPNTASAGMMGIIDYFVQQTDGLPVYEAALANIPLFSGATGHAVRDAMRETSNAVADRARAQNGMSAGNGIVSDKNLWIKPILATAEQDATDGAAGYDADGTGFVLGLDGSINNDMARIGVAVAYTSTDMNSTSGPAHASDVKGTQLMAYVSHSFNAATQFRASADWGTNRAHSMRDIDVFDKVARGRFDIDTFHLGVGLDRAFTLSDRLDAVASVAFDYSKIEVDSFTETGAGPLNQSYAARDYTSAVLGLEGQFVYALNSGTSLIGRAGLAYDSENEMASATTQFVGSGTTFLTEGIESDPMIGRLGVGVERQLEGDLSVSFNYDVETRDGYTEQAASMKLRWEF
jgi:outer membrane autotransporter protein